MARTIKNLHTMKETWVQSLDWEDPLQKGKATYSSVLGLPGCSDGKESACNARGPGSVPGLGRFPGDGNGNSLQYSCLENPMDRGAWQTMVHEVAKSWTRLNNYHFHFSFFLILFYF